MSQQWAALTITCAAAVYLGYRFFLALKSFLRSASGDEASCGGCPGCASGGKGTAKPATGGGIIRLSDIRTIPRTRPESE